ncbi:MAG: hypothetical protein QOF84_304 [Streptomyces sp.]|jgi:hypothetical protein|nr:hypothetical protein [Streptomyces sp.]
MSGTGHDESAGAADERRLWQVTIALVATPAQHEPR